MLSVVAESPRPFLKWAGGKAQLLDQMASYFPRSYDTYFEPFLGGGAVFFHLRPKRAVLSDSNAELIHAYEAVRDDPSALMEALDRHAAHVSKNHYLEVRRQDPETLAPVERAARLIFLNKTCYNGLYRVNSMGQFNVPYGGDYYPGRKPTLYEKENIVSASRTLQAARLVTGDYQTALAKVRKGDLVYLDPPYHPLSETSRFTSYTRDDFGDDDQHSLADTFAKLDRRGALLMLSNSGTPLVRGLYSEFRVAVLKARRAINSRGTGRGPIDELLITNFDPAR